ncbi:glycosyltransferase [Tahibacter amnicola]|uniref:Glycosyltransferase n=1 Tax=Tahibacter amnicola TaxID=2976241 RepID=A0ABY6BI56_9GAMM|nr:glycosyltransferase [Tahibacter amnicola]UXI69698.1 glycosyltransferase [Tahibacter amnicola]
MTTPAAPGKPWWRIPGMVRFIPLYVAINAASLLARLSPGRWKPRKPPVTAAGLTVIVPERGTPDLLAETLQALFDALAVITEPTQVIVVVNGAPKGDYSELARRHPTVEWLFHEHALGYNGAIAAGLAAVRHDWCYLLNSDMRLEPDALSELLPYRRDSVFAVTSQIFFTDPERRREETGWSDYHWNDQRPEVYERTPEPGALARGNLYPGGGSSLCRTAVLRRYVADSCDYSPFYWEDAEWGIRAWSDGWEVLFCPTSRAWHRHRGTVKRYYEQDVIERIIWRNSLQFDIRHGWSGRRPDELMHHIARHEPDTRDELAGLDRAWRAFRIRLATRRAQRRGLAFDKLATDRYYAPVAQTTPRKPRVLVVSPFALFPPAHGGARRVAELVKRLHRDVDFILLSDERSLYSAESEPGLSMFLATHLVEGRGDRAGEAPLDLIQRLERHCWPHLKRELERLIALYDPDIVQIEFMELARLAELRRGRAKWLLALHDVYVRGNDTSFDEPQHAAIARYDAVTACSSEDATLLRHTHVALIGNGAVDRRGTANPSADSPHLLFMGPFRYAQNLGGIRAFLDQAWPTLKQRVPALSLTILGGAESAVVVAADARFRGDGIDVVSAFVDPTPYLERCALTINPQMDIRGSSIKLIESLLAGRVCVSTADGARGFANDTLEGLVIAADIAGMADPIAELLQNPQERRRRESADRERLDRYTWDAMAQRQLAMYRQWVSA